MSLDKYNNHFLSKSLFIKGLQCHKALYLHKYRPELKDPVSASQQAIFESGSLVGEIARNLFPGGILIPYIEDNYDKQVTETGKAIKKGAEVLYEASFLYDGIFVKADILKKGKRGWELYEVKSSTGPNDIYQSDMAVQYYVLKGSGIPVAKAFLVHINNQYVRQGDIDPNELFTIVDMTDSVVAYEDRVKDEIALQKTMLAGDMPAIDIGPNCKKPYPCEFIGHCWQHIPEESVFSLKGNKKLSFSLYNRGITDLKDMNPEELPEKQKQQFVASLRKEIYTRKDDIRAFLDTLWYPLYFLDFETFNDAIPRYDGIRPYQQVPYQYSLHYYEHETSPLMHHEYLATPGIDPRRELIEKLLHEIPDNACVLAYVAIFETGVLQNLIGWLPEYADRIERITGTMIDLAEPFRTRSLYHWQMNGSYSIKYVLPALVPELSYKELGIQDGGMALDAYARMNTTSDPQELEKIRADLLKYCELDTLAMVKILEVLKEAVR